MSDYDNLEEFHFGTNGNADQTPKRIRAGRAQMQRTANANRSRPKWKRELMSQKGVAARKRISEATK